MGAGGSCCTVMGSNASGCATGGMGVISVTVALSVTIVVAVVVMMMRFAIVINTSSARITCLYIAGFSI